MHARKRIDDEALAFGLEELEHFAFYDPSKPPPVPPVLRGSAEPLFGQVPDSVNGWDTVDLPEPAEDGSYGP
jgi:hypothetical protein